METLIGETTVSTLDPGLIGRALYEWSGTTLTIRVGMRCNMVGAWADDPWSGSVTIGSTTRTFDIKGRTSGTIGTTWYEHDESFTITSSGTTTVTVYWSSFNRGQGVSASATINNPVQNYSVKGYVRNQNADGTWGSYWLWIDDTVQGGTTKTYTGYASDTVYQPISWTGTINSNTTFYVDAYRKTFWNNINTFQPDGTTEHGLKFNLTTSDGGSWTDLTDQPATADFTKRYGVTATITNIRSNVTGTHYTTNSVTGTGASTITWTFTASNYAVNLYSAWNTYTIAYNANGGTGAPSSQTKTYGTNLTLSSTKPTRPNYKFLGWSTSSSATTASYDAGDTLSTDLSTTQGATVTLYAVWIPALTVITSTGVTIVAPVKIVNSLGVKVPKQIKKI